MAVEADIVAFEKDVAAQINALRLLVYQDGTTIKDHIDPQLYAAAVKILKDNIKLPSMKIPQIISSLS